MGYTGGDVENATYRNHGTHAEAIEITFDPEQTSYRELLEFFFQIHDPTTLNRQGNDTGTSYRSAIFYLDDEQRRVAEETIADVEASGLWPGQVVTELSAGGAVLGGRARASGLPRALPERIHLSLPAARLGAAPPRRHRRSRGMTPPARQHTPAAGPPGSHPLTRRAERRALRSPLSKRPLPVSYAVAETRSVRAADRRDRAGDELGGVPELWVTLLDEVWATVRSIAGLAPTGT